LLGFNLFFLYLPCGLYFYLFLGIDFLVNNFIVAMDKKGFYQHNN